MSIEETDAASRAVAKNDNRVSLAQIEAAIAYRAFCDGGRLFGGYTREDVTYPMTALPGNDRDYRVASLQSMTICTLVMHNGFVVIGKSAPMDPTNFNAELGRKFAYEDAIRSLWPLFAFSRLEAKFMGPAGREAKHHEHPKVG